MPAWGEGAPLGGLWISVATDADGTYRTTHPAADSPIPVVETRPYGAVERGKRSAHLAAERAKESADAARELADLVGEAIEVPIPIPPVTLA